jgi:uncharacterized protein (DUF2252 family)
VDTQQRGEKIIEALTTEFGELMARDPAAFRRKFQKMAGTAFAFYRGSACLFYADVDGTADPFLDERTSRVWIHGDLHAENFGTYMNSEGVLVFNVNDFDEAYVGPFTWDLKRFAASIALIGYTKALSDGVIGDLVGGYADAYLTELRSIVAGGEDAIGSLTLDSTTGVIHNVLQAARLNTRVEMLGEQTKIEEYERRFAMRDGVYEVDEETRAKVCAAFGDYLGTLPPARLNRPHEFNVKDVVLRKGVGIGSAGLPSYNLLLEGHTQALENDIIVYMKQAQVPAVSRYIHDERVQQYFQHQGQRTCESQQALQAHADPWVGYTTLDGVGQIVAEVSPYAADLDWSEVHELEDLTQVVRDLGIATARMHSVADDDSEHDLVNYSTEEAIVARIDKDDAGFRQMLIEFGHEYGARARADHQIFVDLFRNGKVPGL